jgi:hypothetical protein
VLRRIFGPKKVEMTGGLRKRHNEELHNMYSLPRIIRIIKPRRIRWTSHVTRMEVKRHAYGILMGKPEGKRSLGRTRYR